jgi:fluoroquinolone resistance protein
MPTAFEDDVEYFEQSFTELDNSRGKVTAVTFDECTFQNCSFNEAQFKQCAFHHCHFQDCSFNEAQFNHCTFRDCHFQDCDLSLSDIEYSSFQRSKYQRSKLIGINWAKVSRIQWIEFHDCDISYATFMGLEMQKSIITGCVAKEAYFEETNLTAANCTHTDFSDSRFIRTNLTQADFRGARNYTIVADQNKLKKTKFSMPEALSLLYGLDIILDEPISE